LSAPASKSARTSSTARTPPPHGERQKDLLGGHAHDVEHGLAAVRRRGDVEKADLVRALPVVLGRDLYRIAGVAQLDEAHALFHAARVHVQARDDSAREHGTYFPSAAAAASACSMVNAPS